jgi:glycosyltransferase involved in cell wall biosynthesis
MIAKHLQAPVYNIHYLQYKRPIVAPIKYIAQWFKTWLVLLQERPRYVYVTNPPIFAALCVALYCFASRVFEPVLGRTRFIMDTHPPALYSKRWGWSVPIQRVVARMAYLNVIDQDRFVQKIQSWGARAITLENPPKNPPIGTLKRIQSHNSYDIAVVNTFAVDEPLDPILEAAAHTPDVRYYIMGDTAQARKLVLQRAPENVIFTGYLRGDDYWNCLYNARGVMVLTTYPYSLLGGAQDGVVLHKPLILSDQPALREYFTKGTVFTPNTTEGIVRAVRDLRTREYELVLEMMDLSEELAVRWDGRFRQLLSAIQQLPPFRAKPKTQPKPEQLTEQSIQNPVQDPADVGVR